MNWNGSWNRARNTLLIIGAVVLAIQTVEVHSQGQTIKKQQIALMIAAHNSIQQNVNARHDDCVAGNKTRATLLAQATQLHKQAVASQGTNKLLYKLVPSLDTPEVHAIVKKNQAQELKNFKNEVKGYAAKDCINYALKSVPPKQRRLYSVPEE